MQQNFSRQSYAKEISAEEDWTEEASDYVKCKNSANGLDSGPNFLLMTGTAGGAGVYRHLLVVVL
jgi:hypothetical protein